MRCKRVRTPAEARALGPGPAEVEDTVRRVLAHVRRAGDAAVREYTRRWDGAEPPGTAGEAGGRIDVAAARELPAELRDALELAIANVRTVAEAGLAAGAEVTLPQGQSVRLRDEPVASAGLYAPGGRAPYPSSVIMGVVTARAAGVADVALAVPPRPDGTVHPVLLAAAVLSGATRVYPMGGAQAVAALAYGTESVPPVEVIAGPGNAYVTEAKRQVFGHVGIDGLAGPSDVLVLAGGDADPAVVAVDLLAQAEHGPGTLVVAVSDSPDLLAAVGEAVRAAPDTGAMAVLAEVRDLTEGLAWAEGFAPEHLELLGEEAEDLAGDARRAGCVFVGTGAAFGDYVAGSNHTLPTQGAARWASGLSPRVFRRRWAEVRVGPEAARALAPAGAVIARAEGFERHAASMEWRMQRR